MASSLRRRRSRVNPSIGSSPGTMVIDPSAQKPKIVVFTYGPDHYAEETIEDLNRLPHMIGKHPVTWVQVTGLGDKQILQRLGEMFHLHRLTLEDVTNLHQRPKIESYGEQQFIVARMVENFEAAQGTQQISIFLERKFVLSFQETDVTVFDSLKKRIKDKLGRVRYSGPDYLCYAMMDSIVDQYFPSLEALTEKLDNLESSMFSLNRTTVITELHKLRHELLTVRRCVWPLREVINSMIRDPNPIFTDETKLHLRDCYDHCVQIIDFVESYRELSASLMELSVSLMSHRLNEGIRILTVISTIFIPLNFIAGLYGMNFDTSKSELNMPELKWHYGYFFALGLMALVAGFQLYLFWRKGWLENMGGNSDKAPDYSNSASPKTSLTS